MNEIAFPVSKRSAHTFFAPVPSPTCSAKEVLQWGYAGLIEEDELVGRFIQDISPDCSFSLAPTHQEWEVKGYGATVKFFTSPPLNQSPTQEKVQQIKSEVLRLLETEEEPAAPEAVKYACQLIGQFPSDCFLLPSPDISATASGEVYFEWLLETDGRLLLTVAPDGTVAYVCKFGTARSKNLGAWEDKIADLIPPCFARLVQIHQKDSHEWDAFKIVHPSPDLSSKEKR